MPRRFTAFLALVGAVAALAACKPDEKDATASPSPATTPAVVASPVSLSDALPSPTPDATLPSMPPEIAGGFVFYEDFEKGKDRWAISGVTKGLGWHHLKAATCGGLYTMVLGEAKNPPTRFGQATSYLTLNRPIDLGKVKAAQLQFDIKGATNPPETATILCEARTPGGEWKPLTAVAAARYPLVVTYTADLAPFVGKKLELRFRGATKPAKEPSKGFYLDDIHVVEPRA